MSKRILIKNYCKNRTRNDNLKYKLEETNLELEQKEA